MKVILALTAFLLTANSFAQKRLNIEYNDDKIMKCAVEVYSSNTEYLTSEHLQAYQDFLSSIEIYEATTEQLKEGNYPLISTLVLRNKYNPDLDYDKGPDFQIEDFNPLKYFFVTSEDGISPFYRIYGTNYLVRYNSN